MARAPDEALRFARPDGRAVPDVPAPAAVPRDPARAMQARHDAQGLHIHPRTACPTWAGERLDVGWAIDVLHPRANPAAPPPPPNLGTEGSAER